MTDLPRLVDDRLHAEHGEVVRAIDHCADTVSDAWSDDRVHDRRAVVAPMRAALANSGVLEQLPTVLADLVDHAGYELPADPVAAPPYVVVTSRGPLLRATLPHGRLLVRFDAFTVVRESAPAYERRDGVCIDVTVA